MIWVAAWFAIGVIGYGATYAFAQKQYPAIADEFRKTDRLFSLFVGVCGPIGLLALMAAWCIAGDRMFKHGLRY